MSLVAALQPPSREAQITVTNNAANGVTAASGVAFTFRFTSLNSNAGSPASAQSTSFTVQWGDNSTNTSSASTSAAASVAASGAVNHTYSTTGTYHGRIDTSTNDGYSTKGTTYFTVVVT